MGKTKKAPANQVEQQAAAQAGKPAPISRKLKKQEGHQQLDAAAASAALTVSPEQATKPSKKRAAKDEIDAIFSSKKATENKAKEELNPELQQLAAEVGAARQVAQAAGKRPKVEGSKDDIFGEAAGKARKRTKEGYAVYTEDELGLGKRGGDTPLCPFDCDCCF